MLLLTLVALACAGVGVLAYLSHRRTVARRETLFMFAVSRGWDFTVADSSLAGRWAGTPFGQGEKRRVTNVIRGTSEGRTLTAFDYEFVTTSSSNGGRDSSTQRFAVVVLGMPAYLPTLEVVPETVADRVASAVGVARDIDLESEDFNRKFRVAAANPKLASDVLTPRTMDLLIARPALAFRTQGSDIVSWAPGTIDPVEVLMRASTLDAVLGGVPGFVWRDHGATAG